MLVDEAVDVLEVVSEVLSIRTCSLNVYLNSIELAIDLSERNHDSTPRHYPFDSSDQVLINDLIDQQHIDLQHTASFVR